MKLFQRSAQSPISQAQSNGVVPTSSHDGVAIIDPSVIISIGRSIHQPFVAHHQQGTCANARGCAFFEKCRRCGASLLHAAFARHFAKMSEEEFQSLAKSNRYATNSLGNGQGEGLQHDKLMQAEEHPQTATRMESSLAASDYLLRGDVSLATSAFCRP